MRKLIISMIASGVFLAGCVGDVIRQNDDRYLRPGALDPNLTGYYDVYKVPLLGQYLLTHEWPLPASACKYGSLSTLGRNDDRYMGEVFLASRIYEAGGETRAESIINAGVTNSFDRFVRSQKRMIPISAQRNGVIYAGETVGYEEKEEGLRPLCFQAWVGTSHTLILRLHKRDVETWKKRWSEYNPSGKWSQQKVGDVLWSALENAEADLKPTGTGGWFQSYLAPIGDTGYSLSIQLGATQESLLHPQAHAKMQAMFRRLLESVKVDPLTPAIEAEIAQLKAQAIEVQRQECIEMAKRTKPFTWCQKYLSQ